MLKISKEWVLDILNAKRIDVRELASNPAIIEKACTTVYKAIPIPWRWFVGKKRIRRFIDLAKTKVVTKDFTNF